MARNEGDPRDKNPNSGEEQDRQVSFEDVVVEYQHLKEYLEKHGRAQIQEGKRLMSPEEKIERFGGIDWVKRNLQHASRERVILQACRDGIMVGVEIFRFFEAIGVHPDPSALHYALVRLQGRDESEHGKIKRIPGITLIRNLPSLFSPERSWTIAQRPGYLTTDEGIQDLVEVPERE